MTPLELHPELYPLFEGGEIHANRETGETNLYDSDGNRTPVPASLLGSLLEYELLSVRDGPTPDVDVFDLRQGATPTVAAKPDAELDAHAAETFLAQAQLMFYGTREEGAETYPVVVLLAQEDASSEALVSRVHLACHLAHEHPDFLFVTFDAKAYVLQERDLPQHLCRRLREHSLIALEPGALREEHLASLRAVIDASIDVHESGLSLLGYENEDAILAEIPADALHDDEAFGF